MSETNEPSIREWAGQLAASIVRDAEFFNKTLAFCEAAGVAVSVEIVDGNRLKVSATLMSTVPNTTPTEQPADSPNTQHPRTP